MQKLAIYGDGNMCVSMGARRTNRWALQGRFQRAPLNMVNLLPDILAYKLLGSLGLSVTSLPFERLHTDSAQLLLKASDLSKKVHINTFSPRQT